MNSNSKSNETRIKTRTVFIETHVNITNIKFTPKRNTLVIINN